MNDMLEIKNVKTILLSHPIFSRLNDDEIEELLLTSFEKKFPPNVVIAKQFDPIDAVYIILNGKVEVAKWIDVPNVGKELSVELILSQGDAIGLNDIGFFSTIGVRTATVTTLSEVRIIGWSIENFVDYAQSHQSIKIQTYDATSLILRVNFIKKITLFSDLSTNQIVEIANNVKEEKVIEGTILFKQGDKSEKCYLIQSGKVEISIKRAKFEEKIIVLESPMIFGELALLTDNLRNATAKMIEDGSLLVISQSAFKSLLHSHINVTESIVSLAMERSHPVRSPTVKEFYSINSEGQKNTILKNIKLMRYYQLSPLGDFIWHLLDGEESIEEVIIKVAQEHGLSSVDSAYNIIFNLSDLGFVNFPTVMQLFGAQSLSSNQVEKSTKFKDLKVKLKKLIMIKFIFNDIDSFITKTFNSGIYFFFSKIGKFLIFALALSGLVLFPFNLYNFVNSLDLIAHPFILLALIFSTNYLLVIVHELAHAFSVKYYGYEVHKAGIIFYWIGLFAYVDTSDMWLSNKEARINVDLAGLIIDFFLAGLSCILAFCIPNPESKFYFIGLSLLLYYDVVSNINPIHENDGYHALSGYTKIPKLKESSIKFIEKKLVYSNLFYYNDLITQYRAEIIYWSICVICLFLNIMLSFATIFFIGKILALDPFGVLLTYVKWFLPLLVILVFFLRIYFMLNKKPSSN